MLTLAIGIGATTKIFSVVDVVLINPLPYPTADRLQMIWVTNPRQEIHKDVTSYPNFTDWQAQATTFEAMAGVVGTNVTLSGAGEPKLVPGERVTGRFFDVFSMPALLGRTLQEADTQAGRERVLVLSHALWQGHFGANPAVVGQTIDVSAQPHGIVGVMPAGDQRGALRAGVGAAVAVGPTRAVDAESERTVARSHRSRQARHRSGGR